MPGSTSNRLDFPLASGSPLINAGLFFLLGSRQDCFFLPVLQCNWASLWLLHQTASALSRGFTHTSQEKWEPETPLWCLLVMDTKQQVWHSQTVRKFQIIWQLFLLATPWMCSAKKQKMSLQFSWWRACSSPSAPGSWNVWLSSTSNYLLDFNRGK